jgi:hypothetical protein
MVLHLPVLLTAALGAARIEYNSTQNCSIAKRGLTARTASLSASAAAAAAAAAGMLL